MATGLKRYQQTGHAYLTTSNGSGATENEFTSQPRDVESRLDYFPARYYSSNLGRFMSPDWSSVPEAIPYADLNNPQSLNLYRYVRNNPLSLTDPDGHGCFDDIGTNGGFSSNETGANQTMVVNGNCDSWDLWAVPSNAPPSTPQVQPRIPPLNLPAPSKQNLFSCASEFASTYSAAGLLHWVRVPNSGAGGFIADALGGNAFSGATDLIQSLGSGEGGGHSVFYNMGQGVVAGPTQGFGALFGKAVSGTPAEYALPDIAVSVGHGIMTAEYGGLATDVLGEGLEFASGVGEVKLGIDAAVYGIGLAKCAAGH
jgi:RHS repeat-associated protein